jgi:hypothetical protein
MVMLDMYIQQHFDQQYGEIDFVTSAEIAREVSELVSVSANTVSKIMFARGFDTHILDGKAHWTVYRKS